MMNLVRYSRPVLFAFVAAGACSVVGCSSENEPKLTEKQLEFRDEQRDKAAEEQPPPNEVGGGKKVSPGH